VTPRCRSLLFCSETPRIPQLPRAFLFADGEALAGHLLGESVVNLLAELFLEALGVKTGGEHVDKADNKPTSTDDFR